MDFSEKLKEEGIDLNDKETVHLLQRFYQTGFDAGMHGVHKNIEYNEMYAISFTDSLFSDLAEEAMDWITDKDLYNKIQDLHQQYVDTVNSDLYTFQEVTRYAYYVLKLTEIIFETIESQVDEEFKPCQVGA